MTYTGTDLSRVVEDNDLGVERSSLGGGLVLGVRADCMLAYAHAWRNEINMDEGDVGGRK